MKTIPAKDPYDGVTLPPPSTQVHSSDELNDRIVEMQGTVTDSSQVLDVLDTGQLAKAIFSNAVAAQSMLDTGGVNTVVLTPVTGANGFRVATPIVKTYDLLDGAIFSFKANATNSGNMTVNVGQTGALLIGAQPLFLEDGSSNVPTGNITAGKYYLIRYDASLDVDGAFIILENGLPFGLTGGNDSNGETSIGVFKIKWGKFTVGSTSGTQTFAGISDVTAFPTACFQVFLTEGSGNTGGGGGRTSSITATQFNWRIENASIASPLRFFAIGI